MLAYIEWRAPYWWLLILVPLALALLRYLFRYRAQHRFADDKLLPWLVVGYGKSFRSYLASRKSLWFLVWVLLAAAMAGPRIPDPLQQDGLRETVDIAVVLDMSRSMTVRDLDPDRFRRARIELNEWLSLIRGDRLSLILFAGTVHTLVPLTYDKKVFSYFLNEANTRLMPVHGSRADLALARARKLLDQHKGRNARAVLLVTDGDFDDKTRQALESELTRLKNAGIRLFVLGTGTTDGGGMQDESGLWLKVNNRAILSRLDEDYLKRTAHAGGGNYSRTTLDNTEWKRLYRDGIARLASYRISQSGKQQIKWKELFGWFLVPALLLTALLLFPKDGRITTIASLSLLLLSGLPFTQAADASDLAHIERQAYKAYQSGNYRRASALYRQLPGYQGMTGRGISRYMRGDYKLAARHFAAAVIAARKPGERALALFNLGNTWFRLANYPAAAESYRDALRYRPDYPAARKNLGFSLELIREIKRRQNMEKLPGKGRPGFRRRMNANGEGQGSYGLDEKTINKRLATRHGISPELLSRLIARGLRVAHLADSSKAGKGTRSLSSPLHLQSIRARMLRLSDQGSQMIKSLLELEAGYNAPLEKTETAPGTRPW